MAEGESERRWDGVGVAASARRRKQGKARGSLGFTSPAPIVPVTHRNVVDLIRGAKPQALVDLSAIVGDRGSDGGSPEQLRRRGGVPVPRAGHLGLLRRVPRDCGASASTERRCCAPSGLAGCSGSPAAGTARGQGDTERQSGQGTAGRIREVSRRLLASLVELWWINGGELGARLPWRAWRPGWGKSS